MQKVTDDDDFKRVSDQKTGFTLDLHPRITGDRSVVDDDY